MTKLILQAKVLQLRKQNKSYNQIKQITGVSKSTLSSWLRDYPLDKEFVQKLRDRNAARIEKFRETMMKKRNRRLEDYYQQEKKDLLPLNKEGLLLSGLMLYWGEGNKSLQGPISISNSDPYVLKFILYWLKNALNLSLKKIRVYLQLYKDMNIPQELKFWSTELGIPLKQFSKPYIKTSNRKKINHKGFGHGTCNLAIRNARIKERIMMSIKAVGSYYSNKI